MVEPVTKFFSKQSENKKIKLFMYLHFELLIE